MPNWNAASLDADVRIAQSRRAAGFKTEEEVVLDLDRRRRPCANRHGPANVC